MQDLYILPFDHRGSFIKTFVGQKGKLDKKQKKLLISYKKLIFDGFLLARKQIKHKAGCLVFLAEEFGSDIIESARRKGIPFSLAVEKSGRKTFTFEHGADFGKYILKSKPDFVKVLVRYNPADIKVNLRQLKKLVRLNDWCRKNNYNLLLELLVPATDNNLRQAKGSRQLYDLRIRPRLTLKAVKEFMAAGIKPRVWKIEAFETRSAWQPVIKLMRSGEKGKEVAIVMLGRGASFAKVKKWMALSPKGQLNGFAVGRTVWLRPLLDYHHKKITKKQAISQISKNYLELIKYWEK